MAVKFKRALALAALMFGATGVTAKANATEGWYGRVDAGYSVDGSLDVDEVDEFDFDDDWMGSGGLGYAFANGFRLEGELAFRQNEIEDSDVGVDAKSAMLNLYYDFNRGGRFEPYIGIGGGYGQVELDTPDVDDSNFAYQAMVGVAIGLTERLDLDIGYRYFAIPDLEGDLGPGNCLPNVTSCFTAESFEADYTHQAVTVGLRWQFAAPAAAPAPYTPPPAAPPAPVATCPQSDFVVYFEWDRSALNSQALEVIDSAVARARECNVSAATIVGHTDTSGSTQYNIGLSERRASVVRDALVARGLASSLITAEARGETDLARATRDGVREPLNRRTAVTITFN